MDGPGIQIPAAAPKPFSDPRGLGGFCREDQLLLRFFGEGLRQMKLNRAGLAKWGAE